MIDVDQERSVYGYVDSIVVVVLAFFLNNIFQPVATKAAQS